MTWMHCLNPKFIKLIKYLFNRQLSAFIIIFGRRGTGKTDLSLLIAEILKEVDIIQHFATNIRIKNSPFPIERIINLEDLELWGQSLSGKKLFILDEAGRSMPRRTPMAKLNVELIRNLQIIRKWKLSFEFVTPAEKYIDNTALGTDVLDGRFIKPSYKHKKIVKYEDFLEFFNLTIKNIPRTSINFDTWDSAHFTLKRKIEDVMFEDEELKNLWKYANGMTIKELGLHNETFRRMNKKFLRESLKKHITRHKTMIEGDKAMIISQKTKK